MQVKMWHWDGQILPMAQENHDKMNRLAKGNSCHYDHSQKATAHYELLKVVFNVQEELHSQY